MSDYNGSSDGEDNDDNVTDKREKLYIICPGDVTGDLWHIAAAQILSKYHEEYKIVAVVAVAERTDYPKDQEAKHESNDDYRNGRVTFNFLKDLKLDVILAVVKNIAPPLDPPPTKVQYGIGKINLEHIMYLYIDHENLLDDLYEKQYKTTQKFNNLLFQKDVVGSRSNLDLPLDYDDPLWKQRPKTPVGKTRILQLMMATTIAIQNLYLQPKENHAALAKALGTAIWEANLDQSDRDAYWERLRSFDDLLGKAKLPRGNAFKPDGVILYNARKGEVNSLTDSTEQMRNWFIGEAQKRNLAVLEVATGLSGSDIIKFRNENRLLFDIYRKVPLPGADYPGLNPIVQAALWYTIAKSNSVRGMFGSRSGSMDIAAFVAMNTFFWDAPYLQFLTGETWSRWMVSKADASRQKRFCRNLPGQIPQCLRSLQLYPIMAVGQPLSDSQNLQFHSVREDPFQKWLGGVVMPWGNKANENDPHQTYPAFDLWPHPEPFTKDYQALPAWVSAQRAAGTSIGIIQGVENSSLEKYMDGYIEREEFGFVSKAIRDLGILPGAFPKNKTGAADWSLIYRQDHRQPRRKPSEFSHKS